jgi:hypothetical protein
VAASLADWRIVVTAPLRLTNQLPLAGSLLVWEAAAGPGRELAGRQTVQVESGATVPIHTGELQPRTAAACGRLCCRSLGLLACASPADASAATCLLSWELAIKGLLLSAKPSSSTCAADMRRAVSFTFYPEGYDWVEPTPTLLSEGYSGGPPATAANRRRTPSTLLVLL